MVFTKEPTASNYRYKGDSFLLKSMMASVAGVSTSINFLLRLELFFLVGVKS